MPVPQTIEQEMDPLPCIGQELHPLITPVLFALVVVHW